MKEDRLQTIASKLSSLRLLDRRRDVFGASHHGYRTNPVSEGAVKNLESWCAAPLPEAFREFLLAIGTGAGPEYGLYSLEKMVQEWEKWRFALDETTAPEAPFELGAEDVAGWEARCKADPETYAPLQLRTVNGLLPFQTEGCTYYTCIVLNGPLRGSVWLLDTSAFDTFPIDTGTHAFLNWYEKWLDKHLEPLKKEAGLEEAEQEMISDAEDEKKSGWLAGLIRWWKR